MELWWNGHLLVFVLVLILFLINAGFPGFLPDVWNYCFNGVLASWGKGICGLWVLWVGTQEESVLPIRLLNTYDGTGTLSVLGQTFKGKYDFQVWWLCRLPDSFGYKITRWCPRGSLTINGWVLLDLISQLTASEFTCGTWWQFPAEMKGVRKTVQFAQAKTSFTKAGSHYDMGRICKKRQSAELLKHSNPWVGTY
jgi:hypothetical protein